VAILPLGRGSNLLISDSGFDGVVIDLGMLHSIETNGNILTAQAGSRMSKVAQTAANAGLTGLEFMATVPGDLGGGIAMNAGAFGQQASDTCLHADIVCRDGRSQDIRNTMRDMRQKRSQTQPLAMPNCGSVFKNPEGDYAARLIEASGLKGKRIGGAQISEVHANFIVNHGNAHSDDVIALIRLAQQSVFEKFAINLEPEVRILEGMQ